MTFAAPVALAVPALAAPGAHPLRGTISAPRAGASRMSHTPTHRNTRFAGYWSQGSFAGTVSDATQIHVPALHCTGVDRAIAVGVGMYDSRGRQFSAASLIVGCFNGAPRYFPELVVNGSTKNYVRVRARPGDKVVLRISEGPARTFVSATDHTHPFRRTSRGAGSNRVTNPWVGDVGWSNARSRLEGVPDFGTLSPFDSTLNGRPFGSAPNRVRFDRVNTLGTGTVQIDTHQFSIDREAFETVFEHP